MGKRNEKINVFVHCGDTNTDKVQMEVIQMQGRILARFAFGFALASPIF